MTRLIPEYDHYDMMKDQLTISISTINGSKHWYFSKRMQRNLKTF
ncbi:putative TagE protein [Vibrio parahaemolyticus AQ3810]|nr:putative TagE protein [Vibrio parahaemolyticus AQ3810]